jgi:hypothetical protein
MDSNSLTIAVGKVSVRCRRIYHPHHPSYVLIYHTLVPSSQPTVGSLIIIDRHSKTLRSQSTSFSSLSICLSQKLTTTKNTPGKNNVLLFQSYKQPTQSQHLPLPKSPDTYGVPFPVLYYSIHGDEHNKSS